MGTGMLGAISLTLFAIGKMSLFALTFSDISLAIGTTTPHSQLRQFNLGRFVDLF